MATFRALYDACVLHPAPLRSTPLHSGPSHAPCADGPVPSAFPNDYLSRIGMEAQHPDEFIPRLIDLSPGAVVTAAKLQRQSLRNPLMSAEEFLDSLVRQGLPETVVRLNGFAHLL